jgi:hypothetical protein
MDSYVGENKPIPVLNIDISTAIDEKKAIEQLGSNPDLFYTMLEKFEDMSLLANMRDIAQDVN